MVKLANTILTEGDHTNSRIVNINVSKINDFINEGVAVVPGFKVSKDGELQLLAVVDLMLPQLT